MPFVVLFFFQRRPKLSTNDSVPRHDTICTPKRAFFAVALPSSSPFLRVFLCYIAVFTRRVGALKRGALQFTGVATNPSPFGAPGGWNRGRKKADGACCERRPGGSNVVRVGAGPAFGAPSSPPSVCPRRAKKPRLVRQCYRPVRGWCSPPSRRGARPLRSFVQKGLHRKASRQDGQRGVDLLIFTAIIGRRPLLCVLALAAHATSVDACATASRATLHNLPVS